MIVQIVSETWHFDDESLIIYFSWEIYIPVIIWRKSPISQFVSMSLTNDLKFSAIYNADSTYITIVWCQCDIEIVCLYTLFLAQAKIQMLTTSCRIFTILLKSFEKSRLNSTLVLC